MTLSFGNMIVNLNIFNVIKEIGESNIAGDGLLGDFCVCMDCSRNICHFGHIYDEIEEHRERKGH